MCCEGSRLFSDLGLYRFSAVCVKRLQAFKCLGPCSFHTWGLGPRESGSFKLRAYAFSEGFGFGESGSGFRGIGFGTQGFSKELAFGAPQLCWEFGTLGLK